MNPGPISWQRVRHWLQSPPIEDPIDRRNAPMLQLVLLLIAIPVPLLWLYRIFGTDLPWRPGESMSLATGLGLSMISLLCFALVRQGRFQRAIRLMLVVVAAILLLTHATHGMSAHTYQLPLQVMWLFVAGMTIGRRALWAMYAALVTALFAGGISEARATGDPQSHLMVDAVIRSVMFLVIAVVVDRATRSLRESLSEAIAHGHELECVNNRLQAEILARERAQDQLLHAQKIETVGHLASGLTHDFNHVLGLILGYAKRAKSAEDEAEMRQALSGLESAARRANTLTHGLLSFSRYDATRAERFDAGKALAELEPMLRQALGSRVTLDVTLPSGPMPVVFDRAQLGLAMLNLATNAAQAMPEGGRAELTLDRAGENTLRITLRDDGSGIPPEVQARMFEPFFTTKPAGQGTGLGLAIVNNLVTSFGGRIQIESAAGAGTTICIELPLAPESADAQAQPAPYQANM